MLGSNVLSGRVGELSSQLLFLLWPMDGGQANILTIDVLPERKPPISPWAPDDGQDVMDPSKTVFSDNRHFIS